MTTVDLREERFCRSCGAPRTSGARFCPACGVEFASVAGTPAAMPVSQPGAAPTAATFGGFWVRTAAYLIDTVIAVVIGVGIGIIFGLAQITNEALLNAIGYGIGIGYFVYFWTQGQTPGMKATRLRVQRTDGSALTPGRAALRYLGLSLAFLALGIGVIMVAFDKNKQGWADKIADTYVVRA